MNFWLIERHINDRLHYWSAGATGRGSRDGWSTDWSFATKLADQESAHQVLFRLLDGEGRVAEHMLTDAGRAALVVWEADPCPKCGGTHPGRYEGACAGPPVPSAPSPHKMMG